MPPSGPSALQSLVPVLRYRDVAAAANWLSGTFGFERTTLIPSPNGGAIYAELVHGRGTIMLVPVGQSDLDAHMRQPDELGGIETQTCYVTVADAAAHLESAVKGGAEIVLPLSGDESGQRGYSCRDLEGHIWNFGTYAPAASAEPTAAQRAEVEQAATVEKKRQRSFVPILMSCGLVGLAAWSVTLMNNPLTGAQTPSQKVASPGPAAVSPVAAAQGASNIQRERETLAEEQLKSQKVIEKLRQDLTDARAAAKAAESAASAAAKDLAEEYARRTSGQQASSAAQAKAAQLESDLSASKASVAALETELLKERSARGESVQAAEAARAALESEIQKREDLEQLVLDMDRDANERLGAAKLPNAGISPAETGSVSPKIKPSAVKPSPVKRAKVTKPPAVKATKTVKSAPVKGDEEKPWPYNGW